ncbi:MAG TPA: hypothetical protein VFF27_12655 [Bacteroidia bacterium]|jgi:hypothetical protein|nr:hypothetical protein [Bacteroidia bacterium]
MKYGFLLLAFTLSVICANGATDSILFSKNGNYVLERNIHYNSLNSCSCDYWELYERDKDESTYIIVFENDSVYFLYYDEPGKKTGRTFKTKLKTEEPCTTLASIFKVLSIADYNSQYQFTLPAYLSSDTVSFKNKTLKTHSEPYDIVDSTLYFDINVGVTYDGKEFFNDTISTNLPEIEHHYKVYYSSDNNFYFVQGWYGYSVNTTTDLTTIRSYYSSVLNRIGKHGNP